MSPRGYQGVRVLVLGASGFIGRWLVLALLNGGAQVAVAVRDPGRLPKSLLQHVWRVEQADLSQEGSSSALIAAIRPAVVFNLAGYGVAKDEADSKSLRRVNVDLVLEAGRALARARSPWSGARLIHVGSALEYGPSPASLDESAEMRPTTAYGASKSEATRGLARLRADEGLPCLTARLFTVFGLGERPGRLVPTLLAALDHDESVLLSSGRQSRDWTYVEDVVEELLDLGCIEAPDLVEGKAPFDAPAINLASGRLTTVKGFVELAAKTWGIARTRLAFGAVPTLAEEMYHPAVPVRRLLEATGRVPSGDPNTGLLRMAERLKEGATLLEEKPRS